MQIARDDVDAGRIDFGDISDGSALPPIHPGEILRNDFLKPLSLSVYALAGALNIPRSRLNDIVRGRRAVSADTALRLARYFGTTPDFWMALQSAYELDTTRRAHHKRIAREITPRAA